MNTDPTLSAMQHFEAEADGLMAAGHDPITVVGALLHAAYRVAFLNRHRFPQGPAIGCIDLLVRFETRRR